MQILDFVSLVVIGVALLAALSVSVYAALPKPVLEYAERHGRFQGLVAGERLSQGTPAGDPPVGGVDLLQGYAG